MTLGRISLTINNTNVTTITSTTSTRCSFHPRALPIRVVRMAAIEAVVIFTMVLPTTMVISNCRGFCIRVAIRFSRADWDFRKRSRAAADNEKNAVSDPENNAERVNNVMNNKAYKPMSLINCVNDLLLLIPLKHYGQNIIVNSKKIHSFTTGSV